jgi:hypothetical protein
VAAGGPGRAFAMRGVKELFQLLLAAIAFLMAIAVAAWTVLHSSARATPMHTEALHAARDFANVHRATSASHPAEPVELSSQ